MTTWGRPPNAEAMYQVSVSGLVFGLTRYLLLADTVTVEANGQWYHPRPGRVVKIVANVSVNTMGGNTVLNLRVGGVNKSTITIGATATGKFTSTTEVPLVADDLLSFQVDSTASILGLITLNATIQVVT